MRNRALSLKYGPLKSVLIVTLLAGFNAACSNSGGNSGSLYTGSTENQRSIIGGGLGQPMPPALPGGDGTVTQAPLPPPPTMTGANTVGAVPSDASGAYTWTAVAGKVVTVAPDLVQ